MCRERYQINLITIIDERKENRKIQLNSTWENFGELDLSDCTPIQKRYALCGKRKIRTPVLVVCYTNHALDQFLEGILKFCPAYSESNTYIQLPPCQLHAFQ